MKLKHVQSCYKPSPQKARILYVLILALIGVLYEKTFSLWNHVFSQAHAQQNSSQENNSPSPKNSSEEASPQTAAPVETSKKGDKSDAPANFDVLNFNDQQVKILLDLDKTSTEIQKRGQTLAEKETLIQAASKRVETQLNQIKQIRGEIDEKLKANKKEMQETTQKTAGMYETMKPKEAAKIFNSLEIEPLLQVAKHMKPQKLSSILPQMDVDKAKELTMAMISIVPQIPPQSESKNARRL